MVDPSWYFDSGATDHVAPDLQKFNLAKEYHDTDKLQVGDGNPLAISHIGSSFLHPNLKLSFVLIVPHITKHLLSVSKLTNDNGVYMEFWPSHCSVKSLQAKILFKGDVKNGLYRLPLTKK